MAKAPTELAFWRTSISDLFLGSLKRVFIFPLLGLLIGLLCFYVLNYPLIGGTGLFLPIKWLIALLLFIWFLPLGFVNGLVFSLLYTAGKKFDELHDGYRLYLTC